MQSSPCASVSTDLQTGLGHRARVKGRDERDDESLHLADPNAAEYRWVSDVFLIACELCVLWKIAPATRSYVFTIKGKEVFLKQIQS